MKRLVVLFAIIISISLFFTACQGGINEEENPPRPLSLAELSLDWIDENISITQIEEEQKFFKKEISEDQMYVTYTMKNFRYVFTTDEEHWGSMLHHLLFVEIFENGNGELSGPRGIQIGDDFESTMKKFPQEVDWNNSPAGEFYGDVSLYGRADYEVGMVTTSQDQQSIEFITVVPKGYPPFLKILFKENLVEKIIIYYTTT